MNLAAITALPQPPKTSQKVPRNSAPSRADILGTFIWLPHLSHLDGSVGACPGVHDEAGSARYDEGARVPALFSAGSPTPVRDRNGHHGAASACVAQPPQADERQHQRYEP